MAGIPVMETLASGECSREDSARSPPSTPGCVATAVMSQPHGMGGQSWKKAAGFIASLGPCAPSTRLLVGLGT